MDGLFCARSLTCMHACSLHAHLHIALFNASTIQHAHDIPLGGSGSSVIPAIPPPLGSTFSQSDSGFIPIQTPFRCLNGS